jgi:hypothetical protein
MADALSDYLARRFAAQYAFIRFDTAAFCAARESAYRFTGVTGFAGKSGRPF